MCVLCYLLWGVIDANILTMSPRIPAHPIIDNLMGKSFKNKVFYHNELDNEEKTKKKVIELLQ